MEIDKAKLRRCLSRLEFGKAFPGHSNWALIGKVNEVLWDLQSHCEDFRDAVFIEDADRLVEAVEHIQNDGEQLLKHIRTAQGEDESRPLTAEELKEISQRLGDGILKPEQWKK